MLKNAPKIVQNGNARNFLLARFWGANRLVQKRVLVEKGLMLCLSTEVKTPCVCKPLYEMGTADALNSLTEVAFYAEPTFTKRNLPAAWRTMQLGEVLGLPPTNAEIRQNGGKWSLDDGR